MMREFFPWLREKTSLHVPSQEHKRLANNCQSQQSRDTFMNVNIEGLQQGANHWLYSGTRSSD